MPDDPTNDQIALLCDIGEHDPTAATGDRRRDLDRLLFEGCAEPTGDCLTRIPKLTSKGAAFLGERGAR